MKPYTLLVEGKLVRSLWRKGWSFLNKLKADLANDSAIPLLGRELKEMRSVYQGKLHSSVPCSTIHDRQAMCPSFMDEWVKKTCINIQGNSKHKNDIPTFVAKSMELKVIILSDKHDPMINIICPVLFVEIENVRLIPQGWEGQGIGI